MYSSPHFAHYTAPTPTVAERERILTKVAKVHQDQVAAQTGAPACAESEPPPAYTPESAARDLLAMREGDPDEKIEVPFIYSHDKKSLTDYLAFRNVGTVTRRIVPRPMSRRLYNERYAHDAEGNFIGTGVKAPDAGLVFIPSKGTEQDLLDQVSKMAHSRKNHDPYAFNDGHGMMPTSGIGGGWGATG
ncbi:uncharacterized protein M421DRAFT_426474 [Didymella exigua CBS 183.55]|uniref:Uncharacterized protein n=1 Tax=Didymella exigua CBS 183.55 TaxID=1150837 RepID=A0A6A5R595_9PLEO|nr:uncharacterized protein M421DRAFT_426474 [Didymella exigua CBS 183.55]KAF1922852.1 hypothetical protein M421DRAFT_426474 [Didymella exigua CBS 183.55]